MPPHVVPPFPAALDAYPPAAASIVDTLVARAHAEPFNLVATGIFVLAVLHTFAAAWFTSLAHRVQHQHAERRRAAGLPPSPSVPGEALHFLGEVRLPIAF